MHGDTTPRRRKLPMLGMTTVGLAVGAGSLGLYRGAAAVPLGPPDQPTWTTAEVRTPAPRPPAEPVTQAAAAEVPVTPLPLLPMLPPLESAAPAKPPEPTPWPPSRPVEGLPSPAPVMPVSPAGPLLPMMPSLGVPDIVKSIEVAPIPATIADAEVAPPPRQLPKVPALEAKPVAPPAQPAQLAPQVRPIAPVMPEFLLSGPQAGFNVKSSPEVAPLKAAPGALTSLKVEPPGEAAVIPTRQALKSAALGVALAVSPVTPLTAAEPPASAPKTDAAKVDAPKDDVLGDLKRQVEKLRQNADLEKTFRELTDDAVKGKLNKESGKTEPGLVSKFDELDARLKRMEKALEKFDVSKFEEAVARLEKKLDAASNSTTTQKPDAVAKADPTPKAMPGPATPPATAPAILGPKATIRIVNEYPVPISMMVNGSSHRIEPNASKSVEVQAGSYTYELLHAGSQATTAAIKENDSVTLRIK